LVPPGSWRLPEELFDNIEITNTNRKPACWRTAENQGTKFKKYVVVVIHPAAKAAGILTTRQLKLEEASPQRIMAEVHSMEATLREYFKYLEGK